jgi:ribosomal protein S8
MFRQIKNSQRATKKSLIAVGSKANQSIINNLILNGYLKQCKTLNNKFLQVDLKYDRYCNSTIKEISNVSDSHRSKSFNSKQVSNHQNNLSFLLFKQANKKNKGNCLAILR